MILIVHLLRFRKSRSHWAFTKLHFSWIGGIVLLLFFVSLLEVIVWSGTYLALGALEEFNTALYFSMVTFTGLGYGDIVLHSQWRVLASLQAANGILMFGWTTAMIVASIQNIYFSK